MQLDSTAGVGAPPVCTPQCTQGERLPGASRQGAEEESEGWKEKRREVSFGCRAWGRAMLWELRPSSPSMCPHSEAPLLQHARGALASFGLLNTPLRPFPLRNPSQFFSPWETR